MRFEGGTGGSGGRELDHYRARIDDDQLVLWDAPRGFGTILVRKGAQADPNDKSAFDIRRAIARDEARSIGSPALPRRERAPTGPAAVRRQRRLDARVEAPGRVRVRSCPCCQAAVIAGLLRLRNLSAPLPITGTW